MAAASGMAFADPPRVSLDDGDAASADLPVLDLEMLEEQTLGDPEFLLDLVDVFARDSATTLQAIETALGARDGTSVERGAHRLKGSLGALAALAACEAARQLEASGKAGDFTAAAAAWEALQRELARLRPELERASGRGG